MMKFNSFKENSTAIIFGASGGIGSALVEQLCASKQFSTIHTVTRSSLKFHHPKINAHVLPNYDETGLQTLAEQLSRENRFDCLVTATGILANESGLSPEKTMKSITLENLLTVFQINTFIPTLIAKFFLPLMSRQHKSVFSVLSARVGSISDNRSGGWYSYRSSKTALNMMIKNFSLEMRLKNKNLIIAALQPGTVDTQLSKKFTKTMAKKDLFEPFIAAQYLLQTIDNLNENDNGCFIDWAGEKIAW